MAGLADILNNPEKLQRVSQFLLNFGTGLTQANSQGLGPLASLSYGFGQGGAGLQQFMQQQSFEKDREQVRELRGLQIKRAEKELSATPGFSDKYQVINGKVIDKQTLQEVADFSDPNTAIAQVPLDNEGTYETRLVNKESGETIATLGRGRKVAPKTEVNVDVAGNAFEKEFGKQGAAQFFERRTQAQEAVQSIESNKEALDLLNKGIISGTGAGFITEFNNLLTSRFGYDPAADATANTQAFVATRAREVGRIIKLFGAGTGLSDADREFATKAAAGDVELSEGAIRRILEINDKASRNIIENYNKDASQLKPELSPFPMTVDVPPETDFSRESDPTAYSDMNDKEILGIDASKLHGKSLLDLHKEYLRRGLLRK